ncbi:MAG: S41 family peptidase [Vicinamibacterales bacterium]
MTSRGRLLVLAVSVPVMAFAVIGGFMGKASAQGASYRPLSVFEDVITLILRNYVEEVDVNEVMHGAMHGLADGLDPDSAFLDQAQVTAYQAAKPAAAQVGLELTRQYYLRVIAARDNSPAKAAGLQPGDYIRAINGMPTRDTSVFEGMRELDGAPGTTVTLTVLRGNAAEPHEIEMARAALAPVAVSGRIAGPSVGLVRVPEFVADTPAQIRKEVEALTKSGATSLVIDLRGTAFGAMDAGLAAARLFVPSGTLAFTRARDKEKAPIAAGTGAGRITTPVALLVDNGTAGPAELFAAALDGNDRATLIGERTMGRAAEQKLVPLPDGSGLLLSYLFYLTPGGEVIHEQGLVPDVAVAQPRVDFGEPAPTGDETLDKAIETLTSAKPAA